MNCLEFRRRKLTAPDDTDEALVAHARECQHCRQFSAELLELDDGLRRAIDVPLPENLDAKIMLRQSFQSSRGAKRWQWLGIAASLLAVAVLITAVTRTPPSTLDEKLVAHVGFEEMLVSGRTTYLDAGAVAAAIAEAGIEASIGFEQVLHAHPCVIDDRLVAHLIVRDGDEEFTVLLTPFGVDAPHTFASDGWEGIIEPTDFGAVAVLSPDASRTQRLRQIMSRMGAPATLPGD